jgi:hypothetical protein
MKSLFTSGSILRSPVAASSCLMAALCAAAVQYSIPDAKRSI